jgi:RNA polymerase sigma factor (sigma-70 family)
VGKKVPKGGAMGPAVEVPALDNAEALGAIERAVHGKLRAHRLSESFIERHGEDAVQQGIAEYERALARGSEIDNPGGWIVSTAYRRAIDELRRELREIDEADLPATAGMVNGGELFSPTEEEALDNVSADQLRGTIAKLTAEQRQALGLYYFEERTTREAAALLGCGETTVRRHLRSAMRVLRERFGVVPEPGSELAIEVGFVAWASLAGARVVPNQGVIDQLIGVVDSVRDGLGWFVGRLRDPVARLSANGTGEKIGAVASGPAGKFAGGCAGAAVMCILGGVVGPGIGGPAANLFGDHQAPHVARHRRAVNAEKAPMQLRPKIGGGSNPAGASTKHESAGASRTQRKRLARRSERHQLAEQTSGITRVENESSTYSAPEGASISTETAAPSGGDSEASAGEEAQAQQQFGAFK